VNPAQLSAYFAAHKTAVLGSAAAAVAGLALYQRRKGTSGAGGATTAGATVPGTIPAAAVEPQSLGAYDSTSFDLYNALQPEIEQILQTGTSSGGAAAPSPVASSLLSPSYDGNYVRFADGQIDEVESDGSLLWLNPSEGKKAFGPTGNWKGKVNQLTVKAPANVYNTGKNLLAKNPPAKA